MELNPTTTEAGFRRIPVTNWEPTGNATSGHDWANVHAQCAWAIPSKDVGPTAFGPWVTDPGMGRNPSSCASPRDARVCGQGAASGPDRYGRCTFRKGARPRDLDGRRSKGTAMVTAIAEHSNVVMAGLGAVIFGFWLLLT